MTTKTKIVLGVSLTAFSLSLTGALWGIFMPVGAIFLGLFMNFFMLEKEAALFDEEQFLRVALAEKNASKVEPPQDASGNVSLSAAVVR
jgi:hypothetical protein